MLNILKKRERLAQVNFLQEPKLLYFKQIICEFLVLNFIVFFSNIWDVKKYQFYESLGCQETSIIRKFINNSDMLCRI